MIKNQNYNKNYIKIYLWQILGVVLNFLSLFIVIPKISVNPTIYGVYSLCLSFVIFLSYADLGFLSAGYKYASEHFAKGQKKEEVEVIAFVGFILFVFTLLFSAIILTFAINPNFIFKDTSSEVFLIARKLLLILACSAPFMVCQRIVQIIYGVRLKDYIFQQINVIGNIIKLISVFFFFPKNQAGDIVGYFLLVQLVTVVGTTISIFLAQKHFDYPFTFFIKNFRFNTLVFKQTKALALGSLLLSLSWILYYELDLLVISKFLGAPSAAIYNIGLTILSLFRSMYAILFNPFNARFNHLYGLKDHEGLKKTVVSIVRLTLPIFIFPIFIVSFMAKQLVLVWLGEQYLAAVPIVQLLVFCNVLGFISNPTGILLMTLEKTKIIYKISWLMPIFYWSIILILYNFHGLIAFPIAKTLVFLFMGLIYSINLLDFIGTPFFFLIKKDVFKILMVLILLSFIMNISQYLLPIAKNTTNLLFTICYIGLILFFTLIFYFTFNLSYRKLTLNIINNFKK